jgi:hypothetical protein
LQHVVPSLTLEFAAQERQLRYTGPNLNTTTLGVLQ